MSRPGAELNAWCDYAPVSVAHAQSGPLAGKTLAVKDLYDVTGYPSGWGSPTRLAEASLAEETQSAVQKLLNAGAECIGKSQCDELCYSLNGVNAHYGAPVNPAAPDRITGGSSSGSASLVAGGIVDIATGSDTGGSVRAPASYCGLVGLRTTHGRIPLDRSMILAASFDCFGWFARDVALYRDVGEILLGDDSDDIALSRLVGVGFLDDLLLGEMEREAFQEGVGVIEKHFGNHREMELLELPIEEAYWCFRKCQGYEAWRSLGEWIDHSKPKLGPGVGDRFEFGRNVSDAEFVTETRARDEYTRSLEDLIGKDGLLVLPSSPSCAPLSRSADDELQTFREQALKLLCLSGLSGLPQISMPLARVHGAPMGVSLIGPRGSDRRLIDIAVRLLS